MAGGVNDTGPTSSLDIFWLPWLRAARLAARQRYAARDAGLIRKSVIFFEKIDYDHRPWSASPTPPAMVDLGHFGILADGRPIRLGGRAFDLLLDLINAGSMHSSDISS